LARHEAGVGPDVSWLPDAYDHAPAVRHDDARAVQFNCVMLALFREVGLLTRSTWT
jgi:hypothetical protein